MHKIKIVIFFTDTHEDQMSWSLTKFFINCKVPYKCELLLLLRPRLSNKPLYNLGHMTQEIQWCLKFEWQIRVVF